MAVTVTNVAEEWKSLLFLFVHNAKTVRFLEGVNERIFMTKLKNTS